MKIPQTREHPLCIFIVQLAKEIRDKLLNLLIIYFYKQTLRHAKLRSANLRAVQKNKESFFNVVSSGTGNCIEKILEERNPSI